MNSERIAAILADTSFLAIVDRMKDVATKKAMARKTSNEDRADAIAEFHVLTTLVAQMRSEAANVKED